jgi:tetratricopeptide (TPR) repeat protein
MFLRANGVDARLDLAVADRVDWTDWMTREVQDADRVLVIASAAYRQRSEGDARPGEGRGVQWEARLIRELFYADQQAGLRRFLPVLLPGFSQADIPVWLSPASATHYQVGEFTVAGAEDLLRVLTGQPGEMEPPLGPAPELPRRQAAAPDPATERAGLRTEIVIQAQLLAGGVVESAAWVAGSLACRRSGPLPAEVREVWRALGLPGLVAGERLASAGRALAGALLDRAGQELIAGLLDGLGPQDFAEVVLCAGGEALALPVELIRLGTAAGGEVGPLGLMPAVAVSRRPQPGRHDVTAVPAPRAVPRALAGPLKVLAAVAAPEETKTANPPLDAEAEMAAVLDAVAPVAAAGTAVQVRILEVASLPAIRQALGRDAYHVLHLSAHGSPEAVELEDEDGNPVRVTAGELMDALRHAGRTVPLIVLSSCSGGAAGSGAMAAGLISRGADRVIAMLAPVTDPYATMLARYLYREMAARPELPTGLALARARYLATEQQSRDADRGQVPVPEFGLVTLLACGGDGPLADPALPSAPLPVATTPPGGKLVRDLPMGALIGRRAQLREAMAVMRRDQAAVDRFGAAGGVVLTGIGGIGKTALAGRVAARLADEGWLVAVHEGRWNPTALIISVARAGDRAIAQSHAGLPGTVLETLAGPGDDGPKLAAVAGVLAEERLLVVFDDFEQNLTNGGGGFADPAFEEIFTALAEAAEAGAVLVTCRYPLPGPDRFLARIPVSALSPAELRRLFLRLPALRALGPEDRRVLVRAVGGHPRLIEFTDALLRGGHAGFRHVQVKLRDLARRQAADLSATGSVDAAVEQAMLLGSADILLEGLTGLLTAAQQAVLRQVAVCRAPMTLDDLAFALALPGAGAGADVARLADLTLIQDGGQIVMHPWTAELVTRNADTDLGGEHERALAMRYRRFEQQRGTYEDLVDIPRHLAALSRYDEAADIAKQAERILPGTQAAVAYLAEVRPLIPSSAVWAWGRVAEQEFNALIRAGDLGAAIRQIHAIHDQVQAHADADPASTTWQRALSASHERLGDVAIAAGDLAAARTAYQADLDIMIRLATADPANTGWQCDLGVSHSKLGDVAVAAGDLAAARTAYQASLDIAERLTAVDPANTGWQRERDAMRRKISGIDREVPPAT